MNPEDFNKLLKTLETFRGEQATELIRQNYLRRHVEETQRMLANVDDECFDRNKVLLLHTGVVHREIAAVLLCLYLSMRPDHKAE